MKDPKGECKKTKQPPPKKTPNKKQRKTVNFDNAAKLQIVSVSRSQNRALNMIVNSIEAVR